jgi:hypothetical protein
MTEVQQAGPMRRGPGPGTEGARNSTRRWCVSTTHHRSGLCRVEAPEAGQRKRAAAARNAERHTGCNWGPCETRHPIARPPPGCTQEQYLWKSAPQSARNRRSSARIGIGPGVGSAPGTGIAAGGAADCPAEGICELPGVTAASADWHPPDTWAECCCKHCSAAIPPVGTLAHTFM